MKDNFETQYNKNATEFNEFYHAHEAHQSTDTFFEAVSRINLQNIQNKKVLDLGCGGGADAEFYTKNGFNYYGIDASQEMCKIAKQNNLVTEVRNETFSQKLSYNNNEFGLLVSKYAMQTAENIEPIYNEAYRILESNGYFIYLIVHPFRQFLEKKKQGKDYFKKEFVESIIFDGKIVVTEPTHTLSEYLNANFLSKFDLIDIQEGSDFPNSEQINGDFYPTYLIIIAQKR